MCARVSDVCARACAAVGAHTDDRHRRDKPFVTEQAGAQRCRRSLVDEYAWELGQLYRPVVSRPLSEPKAGMHAGRIMHRA